MTAKTNEKIIKWAGWERGSRYFIQGMSGRQYPPLIDEDRSIWDLALFPLIKKRMVQMDFMAELMIEMEIESMGWAINLLTGGWELLLATPAQFSRALVRVIEEEEMIKEEDG